MFNHPILLIVLLAAAAIGGVVYYKKNQKGTDEIVTKVEDAAKNVASDVKTAVDDAKKA